MVISGVCEAKAPSWPPEVLASIWLPKGAEDIHYEEFGGNYQVFFRVLVCYPASEAIEDMVSAMNSRGWKRMKDDPLNPGLPLRGATHHPNSGWNLVIDNENGVVRYYRGWLEYWEDPSGNLLQYRFTLRSDADDLAKTCDLGVFVNYSPKAVWEQMKQAIEGEKGLSGQRQPEPSKAAEQNVPANRP